MTMVRELVVASIAVLGAIITLCLFVPTVVRYVKSAITKKKGKPKIPMLLDKVLKHRFMSKFRGKES